MSDDRRDAVEETDGFIESLVGEWKAATPATPAGLEARVLQAVRQEHEAATGSADAQPGTAPPNRGATVVPWHRGAAWPRPVWGAIGALAATVAIGSMLVIRAAFFTPLAPMQADRLLVASALATAEAAERAHARAIEQLELAVAPILARAQDPAISGADAARLAALDNRLRFIDQTIKEINEFLDNNPGHSGARATLLTAYTDKTDVLRSVIALDQEISS